MQISGSTVNGKIKWMNYEVSTSQTLA
jgi:hypothetical protein